MLVGYCRVSLADDRQSTDLQRDALINAGIDPRNIFEDRISGTKFDRPGLKECFEYMTKGDVLVVWRLDRLGRSLKHLIDIITDLKTKGIGFKALCETIDTTTATGELLFHLFGAFAQYERGLMRERVLAGLKAAELRGRKGGRPRVMDKDKIDLAKKLVATGRSISEISRVLNMPRTTLADNIKAL